MRVCVCVTVLLPKKKCLKGVRARYSSSFMCESVTKQFFISACQCCAHASLVEAGAWKSYLPIFVTPNSDPQLIVLDTVKKTSDLNSRDLRPNRPSRLRGR